jgi:hypothetical protein
MPQYHATTDILRDGNLVVTRKGVSEVALAAAYTKMLAEGTLGTVFYQGIPTLRRFLEDHADPKRVVVGCYDHDPATPLETAEFCGLGWTGWPVEMEGFKKAECGMVFFGRSRRNPRTNVAFGKLMLRYFFEHVSDGCIDVIFGSTPEPNQIAIRYARKLGFSIHGPIPDFATWRGALCPIWVSHLSKTEFIERGR